MGIVLLPFVDSRGWLVAVNELVLLIMPNV
jgi:hypothetical protein